MEAETIVYYHPAQGQSPKQCRAKKHWWQDAVLQGIPVPGRIPQAADGQSPVTLVDCAVPPFYYRARAWKPEILSESMERVLHRADGMTDAVLHPQIMTWLSEKYTDRWETCRETRKVLLESLLTVYGAACLREQGQAAVLRGSPEETQWQMEMTWGLLEPYLSRINKLLFYYKVIEGTDIWEELSLHLEKYYYEYGLVPQMMPYQIKKQKGPGGRQNLSGVILDYGGSTEGLGFAPDRPVVYVDMLSCPEKEQIFARKGGQILYVSPLNYLDTMVKNSYDRLVR